MDAESVEEIHVELDRMRCATCGYEEICDFYMLKDSWNETVQDDGVPRELRHVLPSERFYALWSALGAQGDARAALLRLRATYDEPHRAYHTARHIGACLRLFDEPEVHALAVNAAEVEAAIWFHDAIYDTHARDNEERSAELARELLGAAGVPDEVVGRIAGHVLATKSHRADSADAQLMLDIDLSILGASPEDFARFEDEIRREYAWVEKAAYVAGRAAVLRGFMDREAIYGTKLLRDRLESRARTNLAASIGGLDVSTSVPGR